MAEKKASEQNMANPLTKASWLSRQTFQWANGTVMAGRKRLFTEDDIYDLPPNEETEYLVDTLADNWQHQRLTKGLATAVARSCFDCMDEIYYCDN